MTATPDTVTATNRVKSANYSAVTLSCTGCGRQLGVDERVIVKNGWHKTVTYGLECSPLKRSFLDGGRWPRCAGCTREFHRLYDYRNGAYCTERCYQAVANARKRDRRIADEPPRFCACGEDLSGRRADARHCSTRCRERAYRRRKASNERA